MGLKWVHYFKKDMEDVRINEEMLFYRPQGYIK